MFTSLNHFIGTHKLLLLILLGVSFWYVVVSRDACQTTLEYAIHIDDHYSSSQRQQFIDAVGTAEALWETATERNLFDYTLGTPFKISLIHDANIQQESHSGAEFDKALYDSHHGIEIYDYSSYDDLVIVLAHEMGHALGLDHVEDPQAIMYYLIQEQKPQLTETDIAALVDNCKLLR